MYSVQNLHVLFNLALNSIEAMQAATERAHELVPYAQPNDVGTMLMAVYDSGVGLAAQIERLFKAFYTIVTEGLEMGLAIRRSIVKAYGGQLWATENGEQDTMFQFTVPAAEGASHV